MVLEREFAINFMYIQWAIILMIDDMINNFSLKHLILELVISSGHHRLT